MRACGPIALLFALSPLVPSIAAAQDPARGSYAPSVVAREWAAEFAFERDFVSLGVLRFRSQRTAWLVNARFGIDRNDHLLSGTPSGERRSWIVEVESRVGRRSYRPLAGRTTAFYGLGATAGWGRSGGDGGEAPPRAQWRVGIFGELGVGYRATSRLSLGVSRSVRVTCRRGSLDDARRRTATIHGWRPRLLPVQLVGTLYF